MAPLVARMVELHNSIIAWGATPRQYMAFVQLYGSIYAKKRKQVRPWTLLLAALHWGAQAAGISPLCNHSWVAFCWRMQASIARVCSLSLMWKQAGSFVQRAPKSMHAAHVRTSARKMCMDDFK
jgi:hypothetical protein